MNVRIRKKEDRFACVTAPPSKSVSHRAILAAALSREDTELQNVALSEDISATLGALPLLGKTYRYDETGRTLQILKGEVRGDAVDCGESGSTMRFLMPVFAALGKEVTYVGRGRLPQRTYEDLRKVLCAHGAVYSAQNGLPVTVSGKLRGGEYTLKGSVSSQYVTGLLFALPLLHGNSRISLTDALQSAGYVKMTEEVLRDFGVESRLGGEIRGGQEFRGGAYRVEGDFSNAAFFMVYGALNGGATVKGLNLFSAQGDREICSLLREMGARVDTEADAVTVYPSRLKGIRADVGQIPDLAPILSVAMACAEGESELVHAERLRAKESDRLQGIYENLRAVGIRCEFTETGVKIYGGVPCGESWNGYSDHRMVMSGAVMASQIGKGLLLTDAEAVKKSYPDFFESLLQAGGTEHVVDVG